MYRKLTAGIHRCTICDAVSLEEISNNPENYKPRLYFYESPEDVTDVVCQDCLESVEDVSTEYIQDDDELERILLEKEMLLEQEILDILSKEQSRKDLDNE